MKKTKFLLILTSSVILIGILYWNFNIQIRDYFFRKHVVFWKKNVSLKSTDFQAQIDQNSQSEIWVYFGLYLKSTNLKDAEVKAYFDKNKSWVKDTLNFEDKIEFQKLRFDLYENYARKFNKEIDKIKFDNNKSFSDLQKIGDKIYSELIIMEDSLCNTDLEKNELIKFWRLKIDKMLKTNN